ncbi:uncharacterized protein LACBIDRAFT_295592, partial [Laccaria bicolor S238N-H82]
MAAPVPTGTYTIQDVNGNFATAPLILGQPIQFNAPTGAQNQNWLIATIVGVSTIRSAALAAFAWVAEPSVIDANVSVNQGERRWVTAVDGNQGTIRTVNDPQLFWARNANFSAHLLLQLNSFSPKSSELNEIKLLEHHSSVPTVWIVNREVCMDNIVFHKVPSRMNVECTN